MVLRLMRLPGPQQTGACRRGAYRSLCDALGRAHAQTRALRAGAAGGSGRGPDGSTWRQGKPSACARRRGTGAHWTKADRSRWADSSLPITSRQGLRSPRLSVAIDQSCVRVAAAFRVPKRWGQPTNGASRLLQGSSLNAACDESHPIRQTSY